MRLYKDHHFSSITNFHSTIREKMVAEDTLFKKHSHDKLSSGLDHVLQYLSFICKMLAIF